MIESGIVVCCKSCGSKWENKSKNFVTKCPFCGGTIPVSGDDAGNISKDKEPPFDNSGDALKYIMKEHGIDVLLGDRLISYLSDYAPGLEKIRRNTIATVISAKVPEIFKANMKAGVSEKEAAFRRAVRRVVDDYGTDEKIVHGIVSEFTAALGWEINIKMPEKETNEEKRKYDEERDKWEKEKQELDEENRKLRSQLQSRTQNTNTSGNMSSGNTFFGNTGSGRQSTSSPPQKLAKGQRNVKFGKYNWRVLDVQGGKALLLSEDVIETRAYNDDLTSVTWEKCDLRKYLNGEFKKNFSGDEQKRIFEVVNKNSNNQWYETSGGRDTRDSIFLLSIEEVVKYFGDSGQLKNRPGIKSYIDDQYNEARIAKYNGEENWWWLRSPGDLSADAAFVHYDGSIYVHGILVYCEDGGLRPALWINL